MAKSKRLRKKETKRENIAYIESRNPSIKARKLSSRELAQERKRIERNETRQKNRAESKAYFLGKGFDVSFINKYRLYDKKVSSYKAADLNRLTKMQALERAGFTYKKTDLKLGWVRLADKYPTIIIPEKYQKQTNKIYTGKTYLYVGAAQVRDTSFKPNNYNELTVRELKAQIRDRLNEAKNSPDNSDDLICAFKVYSGSKEDMNHIAGKFYSAGYNFSGFAVKLDGRSYAKITVSNKWSEHEFLSMILCCITQMGNDEVPGFIQEMVYYCNVNDFPFMKGI